MLHFIKKIIKSFGSSTTSESSDLDILCLLAEQDSGVELDEEKGHELPLKATDHGDTGKIVFKPDNSSMMPEEPDSLAVLRILLEQGDWSGLEEKSRAVLSNNPHQEEVMALLARSLQMQGCLEEALTFSIRATKLLPDRWLSQFVAGITLKWLGRETEACDYLRRAAALAPNDAQTLQQLNEAIAASEVASLRSLSEQRSWIELEEKSRKLLLRYPDQDEAMTLLAYSLQQQGRLEEAITYSLQAITYSPDRWLSLFITGSALIGLGKEEEASDYLRRALSIFLNDDQTLRLLCQAVAKTDGLEQAAEEYVAHRGQVIGRSTENVVIALICMMQDWAKNVGLPLLDAGDVEEVPFENPYVWGETSSFERRTIASNKPYVVDIKNARIFSNSSLILTSDGTVLNDTGGHPQFGRYVSFVYEKVVIAQVVNKVLLDFTDYSTREIESGVYLSGLASNAFGHWIPEFLPKLQFLKQHPDFAKLPIIVDANMPESHFWHLRRLVDNPLIMLQPNESFLCQRLLVAPSPTFWPVELVFPHDIPLHEMGGVSPQALRFLRGNLAYDNTRPRNRRIFLSRKNLKWMRLLNEEEVTSNLSKLGFETVFIEEMTASEQVDMFQHAEWIIAPGGSALMNLTFADPSVKLLVFINRNVLNWGSYAATLRTLGYQPVALRSDYMESSTSKHVDYSISLQHLHQALADMGMDMR